MNARSKAINSMTAPFLAVAIAMAALPGAQAATTVLSQSALNDSPGVYTAGGYYTTTLGPNIVTTGGGNAANVGLASGRNDDGFMSLPLGFDFTFFGTTYSSLFINNNGNVSFGSGISAFVPTGPTGAAAPVISVFFSDVDTRDASSGVVHYNLTSDQLVVTWDNVGRYRSYGVPPSNSFQLVLRSDTYTVPAGEGQIGFFYEEMDWEDTDTSTTGAVGFGNGTGDAIVIDGSNVDGMNAVVEDHYIWFSRDLAPVCGVPGTPDCPSEVPEPSGLALVGMAIFVGVRARRRRA